jgi:hypothetical protein
MVQHQTFVSLWYRRYRTNGTDTLVLYRRDRPKGRFGTVGSGGWLVRLYGQRTLTLIISPHCSGACLGFDSAWLSTTMAYQNACSHL